MGPSRKSKHIFSVCLFQRLNWLYGLKRQAKEHYVMNIEQVATCTWRKAADKSIITYSDFPYLCHGLSAFYQDFRDAL